MRIKFRLPTRGDGRTNVVIREWPVAPRVGEEVYFYDVVDIGYQVKHVCHYLDESDFHLYVVLGD